MVDLDDRAGHWFLNSVHKLAEYPPSTEFLVWTRPCGSCERGYSEPCDSVKLVAVISAAAWWSYKERGLVVAGDQVIANIFYLTIPGGANSPHYW
jgi:hypothetical protein